MGMDKYPHVVYGIQTLRQELGDRIWELEETLEDTELTVFIGEQDEVYIGLSLIRTGGPAADAANEEIKVPDQAQSNQVKQSLAELMGKPIEVKLWFFESWN